jgi:hypothetical protein
VAGGREAVHVGADLGEKYLRGEVTDARDGRQPLHRFPERAEVALHLCVDLGDHPPQAVQATMNTEPAKALYRQRKQTVEPVFGIVKAAMGFRQFLMRGLAAVEAEWTLVALACNAKRMARLCPA